MVNKIKDNNLRSKHYYLLLGVIVFFVIMQSLFLLEKKHFVIDEDDSFLISTGKMDKYLNIVFNRKYPYGELVDISKYKDLFKIDDSFCFKKIATSVVFLNVHPPLYFWLLHIWILIYGGQAYFWSGVLLNLIISMFIIILLFKLAFEFFHSFEDALFVAILFSLSPVVYNVNTARPYFLLTLITVSASYFLLSIIKSDKKINLPTILFFSIFICLGLLCHYTFIFICISWFIFIFLHYTRENKQLIFSFIFSCLIGFLLFCNIYPNFISNFINYNEVIKNILSNILLSQYPNLPLDSKVSQMIVQRSGSFFSEHQKELLIFLLKEGQIIYYISIISIAILFLWLWFSIKENKSFRFVFASWFYSLLFLALFYFSKKSLFWIVYDKYFLFILPFFYLCIIFFLNKSLTNLKMIILVCLCQILFFSTLDNLITKRINSKNILERSLAFSGYLEETQERYNKKYVVLDNSVLELTTGLFINRFLDTYNVPEKTKILVADSSFLLSNYSNYFGNESVLFPFTYITNLGKTTQRRITSINLLKKIIEDKNIKLTLEIAFCNLSGEGEIVFKVDKAFIK